MEFHLMADEDHRTGVTPIKSGMRHKAGSRRTRRLADLLTVLQEMTEKEFTGHIKINFTQGGIGRIEKYEEILRGSGQETSTD
jgi:hypothetical protein